MTDTTLDLKRGTTFRASFDLDFDLTGYVVTASVSTGVSAVDDLDTRIIDEGSGWVEIEAAASLTEEWPLRLLRADVKCVLGDEVVQTQTFLINVLSEIT